MDSVDGVETGAGRFGDDVRAVGEGGLRSASTGGFSGIIGTLPLGNDLPT